MSELLLTVLPVYAVVALGYAAVHYGILSVQLGAALIRFMYFLAIPAMLFVTVLDANLPRVFPWRYLLAFYCPSIVLFIAGMGLASRVLQWPSRDLGIAGMTSCYSNVVLLGFPLVLAVFGDEAAVPLFILLASQSVLLFPLTTVVLEATSDRTAKSRGELAAAFGKVLLNPIVLGLVLGVLANLAGITLSRPLEHGLRLLGAAAPGCALVALGITLAGYQLRGGWRDITLFLMLKNLAHPLLVWFACMWLGIDRSWTVVAVMLAAMPSGINAFIFAAYYQRQTLAVSRTILWSTFLSTIVASTLVFVL